MARTVSIGCQDFETLQREGYFYIDKTSFIKEWWEEGDSVTLITRPRRFGKTLNMSMTEQFFSIKYAGRGDLFENLAIWKEEKYRKLQGTYPVISLSFASIKDTNYETTRRKICQILTNLYSQYDFLLKGDYLNDKEKKFFESVTADMGDVEATFALHQLSLYLSRYYGKKVIILLDEYDTPMQEAYVNGYRDELVSFTRSLFNASFKTNPYLERAIMTGITRVSRESIFSDLNNLKVVTTTSDEYADCFGFTEEEVFTFSTFDTGNKPSEAAEPERFYHGFVLGLLVELSDRYTVTSNRESGFGRYDVLLEPKQGDDGIILEFKVQDTDDEKELSDTVKAALQQIENKKYETLLTEKGIPKEKIRKYAFAFCGEQVLIGKASD